ncbi:MAG: hypothetical protein ACKOUT_15035 [Novosphingobium sp.]
MEAKKSSSQKQTIKYDVIDKMTPIHRLYYVVDAYNKASSMDDVVYCSELWAYVKTTLALDKLQESCEEAKRNDMDIAKDLVMDLFSKPVKLVIAILQLLMAFAGKEENEFKNAIKEVASELWEYGLEKKVTDPAKKAIQEKIVKKALDKGREATLRYLQKVSKRSRKHFSEVLDKLGATIKTVGGTIFKAGEIFFTPSQIAPELCGTVGQVEEARNNALQRVMKAVGAPSSKPPLVKPLS